MSFIVKEKESSPAEKRRYPCKGYYKRVFEKKDTEYLTKAQKERLSSLDDRNISVSTHREGFFWDAYKKITSGCPCDECKLFSKCAEKEIACREYWQWVVRVGLDKRTLKRMNIE